MKCAIPHPWELREREIVSAAIAWPRLLIVSAALLTTILWAAIIGAVCAAAEISLSAHWSAGILVSIFALALMALSIVTSSADPQPQNKADLA
jgi:hypothetical protein